MQENIETHVLKISEQEGMTDAFLVNTSAVVGQGYLSDINIVNVQGKTKAGKESKISYALKIAAKNKILRQVSEVSELFKREIYMYEYIFPAFHDFEKQKNIENPFSNVPKFYKALKNTIPEALILEDLNESGYQSWNAQIQMEHEQVEIVLKEYGRFHAISFAIRDQNPKLFHELTKGFDNVLIKFLKSSGFFDTFVYKAKRILALLDSQEDSNIFKKYEAFVDGIEEKFEYLISANEESQAVLHGDCWSNNMLFKYEDFNKQKPVGIRLIDFQLAKLGSPVFDVVYFFYTSTSEKVLKDLNQYKRIYYNSLSEHLKALGSSANNLYPFKIFEEHWKKYATYGLIISSLVKQTLLIEENEVINLTEIVESGGSISKTFERDIANMNEYKKRMKNIIEHFVENHFI